MTLAVIALAVVLLWALFEWWGRKPMVHHGVDLSGLPRFFEVLLEPGQTGGLMFLRPSQQQEDGHFLQFVRYGVDSSPGIRFSFPRAPWSEPIYDRLVDVLRDQGFPVSTEPTEEEPVREFAILNLGPNPAQASKVAGLALEVMGCPNSQLDVWFKGVGPGPLKAG